MKDNSFTNVDIKSVTESFRNQGIPEDIISIAVEDMEKGIPKEKIMIYASAGGDVDKVKSMSKALQLGASERVVQKIGVLDKLKNQIIIRELEYGVPEDTIFSVISRKNDAHAMDQIFKRYRDNMANTEPIEPEKDKNPQIDSVDATSEDKDNKEVAEDVHKVYIKSEDIVDALSSVIKQISDQMMQQFAQVITPVIEAIPKPNVEKVAESPKAKAAEKSSITDKKPDVIDEADRTIIKEESARPRMVFVDDSVSSDKAEMNTDSSEVSRSASNVIDFTGDYHMYLTTPDGQNIPVHMDQNKPKKPKNVLSIAERFFKGSPSQKSLLRMLIEGRLNPEQLKQIQRAKEANFTDMELKDLIESGLPADEMSGIIDVVMSDKRVAV